MGNNIKTYKWMDLCIKDKVAYATALASFVLGWVLIGVAFVVAPLGQLDASVISVFGMALVYTASILGVSLYWSGKFNDFSQRVQNEIEKR